MFELGVSYMREGRGISDRGNSKSQDIDAEEARYVKGTKEFHMTGAKGEYMCEIGRRLGKSGILKGLLC